jgi:SAM-dependent methyltransferase
MEAQEDDIAAGDLTCPQCARRYPIANGIAILDPKASHENRNLYNKYETAPVVSSYLWSHYADIVDEENASAAYRQWADLMHPHTGVSVDAGSAVGRFTFEMSRKSDFAVGLDNSYAFIQTARDLMKNRSMAVRIKEEGHLSRNLTLNLPDDWDSDKVEFVVGDAMALPFRSGSVSSLASLNLVDKVPRPIQHLNEMNRVTRDSQAQFLLSDPFSWSEDAAKEEDWLGGKSSGLYAGKGIDNIIALLKGAKGQLPPQWRIEKNGQVWWRLRTHANHFEQIRSCYVKAVR